MFNNVALDIFIGLVFVFLLYSLLATIVQEIIATWLAFRSKVLEKAILRMLEDGRITTKISISVVDRIKGFLHMFGMFDFLTKTKIAPWFYAHPLIKYLAEDNYYSKPAYLEAKNFSKVMIDLLKGIERPDGEAAQAIQQSIDNGTINQFPINPSGKRNPAVKVILKQYPDLTVLSNRDNNYAPVKINPDTALFIKSLWIEAEMDLVKFKLRLEEWFDSTMERASGWYKRYTQVVLFMIGMLIAYLFNVDAIAIKRILTKDKTAREQMVEMAVSSQNKIGKEINQIKVDSSNKQPDTVLMNVYNMVKTDAEKANNVLGLGKPWKDSCAICDSFRNKSDSAEDKPDTVIFKLLFKKLDAAIQKKWALATSDTKTMYSDSVRIFDSLIKKATTAYTMDSFRKKKVVYQKMLDTAKNAESNNSADINRLSLLVERCPVIFHATDDKWFAYSPNQSGGWETFFGWMITALAISLGAPFWFDLLSKLVKVRGTGTKVDSTAPASTATSPASAPTTPSAPSTVIVNNNAGEEAVG